MAKEIMMLDCDTEMSVPFVDLRSEHVRLRGELENIWNAAMDKAAFIGGPEVEAFENAFARFCGVKHAVGVANGTDALLLALKALQISPGDEVITAANSFVATAEAIVHAGAHPVFVDIDPRTYNIDVSQIERHITPRTKGIIPVHLFGQTADMAPILALARQYGLKVIEDASQAHGARYHGLRAGSIGHVACFSFYPAKNLGACGDGGAVVTDDPAIANQVRKLRDHGGVRKYEHQCIGFNSRLDSIQAAILRAKLTYLDERNERRREIARAYDSLLTDLRPVIIPYTPDGFESVFHLYVIRIANGRRDELQEHLQRRRIQTGIHYPAPIYRTPAFAPYMLNECPVAEHSSETILSLPMYPEMEKRQVAYVVDAIGEYLDRKFDDARWI